MDQSPTTQDASPSWAAGVHRRDFGQYQDDAGSRAGKVRQTPQGQCPVRQMGNPDPGLRRGRLFIAGLRHDALTAPWVIPGAMDRQAFDIYIETQLAPTLAPGDVVILDNLSVHKSAKAEAAVQAKGAWMLFLPQYSPDLNPIDPSARSGGLLKTQSAPAQGRSPNLRRTDRRHRRHLPSL